MVWTCRNLIRVGFNTLTKSTISDTYLRNLLRFSTDGTVVTIFCSRHLSLTRTQYCEPLRPSKIKKEPVTKIQFQNRFFKYLRDNGTFNTVTPRKSVDVGIITPSKIKELTNSELPIFIFTTIVNGKLTESLQVQLDEECCSRLSSFATDDILKVIDAWLYYVPHILNKLKFYRQAMPMLDSILSSKNTNQAAFVQAYFYVSLCKQKKLASEIIRRGLDKLQYSHSLMRTLSLDELVIISVSTFRTSNTISSRALLRLISDSILTHLPTLLKDDASLVSLIKPLRPAEFYDLKLLDALAMNLSSLKSRSFLTKIQIFALFGQSLYPNKDFLQKFADDIGSDLLYLLENKETMAIRIKDVSRFLWALSFLDVVPSVKNLDKELMEKLEDWTVSNSFNDSNMHWLVSMMCSILIFNWDYEKLFQKVFATFPAHQLNVPNHSANFRNLNLLIAGLRIEAPHLVSEDLLKVLKPTIAPTAINHLRTRPVLKDAYKTVWSLTRKHDISDILCHFNIPHVLILGLTFYTPKRNLLNIEVLDRTNCLLTSNIPHGLMSLKLRLLEQSQEHVLIIDSTKITKYNNFLVMFESKIKEIDEADSGYIKEGV